MLRTSQDFKHSDDLESSSPEARLMWLRETAQINFTASKLRILSTQITQLQHSDVGKALAIHKHIKSMPFGCVPGFNRVKATDIVQQGYGDCHTKGLLYVALLRAVHIPARLRFVTVSTQFLNGLIETGTQTMVHAVGEAFIDGRWRQNDTYVVDVEYETAARSQLRLEDRILGYGIHAMGDKDWNGVDNAHSQYTLADPDSLPIIDWGSDHDPAHFYADENHAGLRHNFATRVKWTVGASIVNRKVALIREREQDRAASVFDSLSPKLD
jgi:Transglutaminase-like superfamily